MAQILSSGVLIRHINIRYHFIREHIEDSFVNTVFVRADENDADILTKNVNKVMHEKYVVQVLERGLRIE